MPAHSRFPRVPGTLQVRRIAVTALCVTTGAAAALGISLSPSPAPTSAPANAGAAVSTQDRANALQRSNRGLTRTVTPTPGAAAKKPSPKPPAPKPKPKPKPHPAAKPKPQPLPHIAGLSSVQVANAWAIVLEGHRMGISQRGQQIAIATAMQESNLYNLTRAVDHDSLGLFQQRPSTGWGAPRQLTNPTYAAHAFYAVLVLHRSTWGTLWRAAQIVQRSAFPYAYQKHSSAALNVVRILDKRF